MIKNFFYKFINAIVSVKEKICSLGNKKDIGAPTPNFWKLRAGILSPLNSSWVIDGSGSGTGDMLKTVYDKNGVADDAFDMDNMVEGTNNKLVSGAEKSAWSGKMSNPMSAKGDIIYGGDDGAPTKLVKGDDDKILKLASGVPTWASEQDVSGKIDKSTLTAKGALISASGVSTPSTLTAGTNGQLLSADSNETAGLKWIDAPSKAISSEVNTGSDDAKFITPSALSGSKYPQLDGADAMIVTDELPDEPDEDTLYFIYEDD